MIALDPTQNVKLPRDMLLESCLQILGSYRRRCLDYNSGKKSLVQLPVSPCLFSLGMIEAYLKRDIPQYQRVHNFGPSLSSPSGPSIMILLLLTDINFHAWSLLLLLEVCGCRTTCKRC